MKVKLLVGVAISSFLAASMSFAAPSMDMVDDATTTTMQNSGTDATAGVGNMQNAGGNDMATPGNMNTGAAGGATPGGLPSDTSNANDDMSADTATGDDDY